MNKLSDFLDGVVVGQPQSHGNMTVFPLRVKNGHTRGYQTLDEALKAKTIEVMEVSEGGSVPSLTVRNTGPQPILLVLGEELIGAKQNRVLNTSLLVPAQSELKIPVSCVEQGRWSYGRRDFTSGSTASHSGLRRMQSLNVTRSLMNSPMAFDANQSEVWGEVARKIGSHGSSSPTRAMHDMYRQTEGQLKEYLDAFPAFEAEGATVAINGRIVGTDVFDHHETLEQLWPKLLRSYAVDALERRTPQAQTTEGAPDSAPLTQPDDVLKFLNATQNAKDESYDSVGIGKDIRLSGEVVNGSGLLWEDKVVHASLFSARS